MYNIVYVSEQDVSPIEEFLEGCEKSLETFRYYSKRDIKESVQNHKVTIISLVDGKPVGYGHLDVEDEKTWLGICLADDFIGMGYGSIIMKTLLDKINFSVYLSVDVDNFNAIKLYRKFGFVDVEVDNETLFMERL